MTAGNESLNKSPNGSPSESPNESPNEKCSGSYKTFSFAGMALDPIHVGTGGARLGRVDNTACWPSAARCSNMRFSPLRWHAATATRLVVPGR